MEMIKYTINHLTVDKPEINLPKDSQVVGVEFLRTIGWHIVWLEPKENGETGSDK